MLHTIRYPLKLFFKRDDQPQTAALFYTDSALTEIGMNEIGGIVMENQLYVGSMCTIPIKFGNGERTLIKVKRLHFKPPYRQSFNRVDDDGKLTGIRWGIGEHLGGVGRARHHLCTIFKATLRHMLVTLS